MDEPIPGYRFGKQLGTGAGSKIFLATEIVTGKSFAVKHIVRNTVEDDKFIEQLETEYAVTSAVEHPMLRRSFLIHRVRKLIQLREIFLVMEYVDGLPLETARPNRLNTFLTVFRKVAEGLDALHEAGYVHADIKQINVMIARGGTVKIIDFGQACKIGHKKDRVQGTPDYIAPEQVRRMPLDRRTDVFNFGATMYWVLTSEKYPTVLRGNDARGGINLTSAEKPLAPNEWNDKIPIALSNMVMECCRENPGERPVDMKQVSARLGTVQNLWHKYRESRRAERSAGEHREGKPASRADDEPLTAENLGKHVPKGAKKRP